MFEEVHASAPGKVLLTGGYLVLDCRYTGCVISTSSRFHCCISSEQNNISDFIGFQINSPQFTDEPREYAANIQPNGRLNFSSKQTEKNKFIEIALEITFSVAAHILYRSRDRILGRLYMLTIKADNDFYSQRDNLDKLGLSPRISNLSRIPKFAPTGLSIENVKKTGLGSSAALVTSIVAAILSHLNLISSEMAPKDLLLVHNIAQYSHCLAQGKIGSGFDVSSAVYGSQIYRRFEASELSKNLAMDEKLSASEVYEIIKIDSQIFDLRSDFSFRLPPGLRLNLADIDSGSNTPRMVSAVLEWKRRAGNDGKLLWEKLNDLNVSIEKDLKQLRYHALEAPQSYQLSLASFESNSGMDNETTSLLHRLCDTFSKIRSTLRVLSHKSGVPVEPETQTRLLDACMKIPGVLFAGVPGAGGFDAIFCITISQSAINKLDQLWSEWNEVKVCPLMCEESSDGVGLQLSCTG